MNSNNSNAEKSTVVPIRPLSSMIATSSPQLGYRLQIPGSPISLGRLRSRSLDHPLSPVPTNYQSYHLAMSPLSVKPIVSSCLTPRVDSPTFFSNSSSTPPEPSERQKAMEAAVAAERRRVKELELEEVNMTADELRVVLKTERRRTAKIAADLASFRMAAVELQSEAEMVEEGRINGLMRRLEHLQQEKGKIIFELEREEEMLTNTLQKQLNQLRQEKTLLQQQIDREKRSKSSLESHLTSLKESNEAMGQVVEVGEEEEEEEEEEEHMGNEEDVTHQS